MLTSKLLLNCSGLCHGFGTIKDSVGPTNVVLSKQVHGKKVLVFRDSLPQKQTEADATITNISGLAIGITTADCVPVLIFDPIRKVAAAVHAGWKGSSLNIVGETVLRMQEEFFSKPSDLVAAIGPAIGPHCFEVAADVANIFRKELGNSFVSPAFPGKGPKKFLIDLFEVNRRQLLEIGVLPELIEKIPLCTHCRTDLFHSVRRSGDQAGRQITFITFKS